MIVCYLTLGLQFLEKFVDMIKFYFFLSDTHMQSSGHCLHSNWFIFRVTAYLLLHTFHACKTYFYTTLNTMQNNGNGVICHILLLCNFQHTTNIYI
jgi:hypothetical protein